MAPPLFGVEFIRRRQKRRKKARLSKMPSQPARDKGCGTQRLDTHNAACGIETRSRALIPAKNVVVSTHTMLRAALKLYAQEVLLGRSGVSTHTMLRAALTTKRLCVSFRSHRAVFVCKKRTAILTMRRTDVRTDKFGTTILRKH